MRLIGHGVDLVSIEQIATLLDSCALLSDWLSEAECESAPANQTSLPAFVAGRIALKEAVVKALGCGFVADITWDDIEVLNDSAGAPTVQLTGAALQTADSLGIMSWLVSLSHDGAYALASALAVQD